MDIIIVGSLVTCFAGILTGLTGFGGLSLLLAVLSVFLSPKTLMPMCLLQMVFVNSVVLFYSRKSMHLKRIWILVVAGIIGTPFGTLLLVFLDPNSLKC